MKKSWYATREGLTAPLVMYFVALILLGIGNNFSSSNETVSLLLYALRYCGGLIKMFFPLVVTINVIGKKHQDSVPIIAGVISYVLLHVVTMFVADQNLPSSFYNSFILSTSVSGRERAPLNMGLLASLIVVVLIILLYKHSRQRLNYGLFRFIDNDSWFLLLVFVATIIIGVGISLIVPYFYTVLEAVLNFIAENSSNPAALFIYGLLERVMEIAGVENILHESFWFGNLGGNWLSSSGAIYVGDINIWTAQLSENMIQAGVGKYITPYYVINMSIVPAIMIGIYCQYSNKMDRRRVLALLLLAIATSLCSSSLVPLEYLLIIISPTLLVMNTIVSSTLYGVFMMISLWLGYSFNDALIYATPGTIIEFIDLIKYMSSGLITNFVTITVIYGLLSFASVWVYYLVLAQEFLDSKKKVQTRREMIKALGGIHNINVIDCTPFSLKVAVFDDEKVDETEILDLGASRIIETYFYREIEFGPGSVSLYHQIKKELKEYQGCLKYIEAEI